MSASKTSRIPEIQKVWSVVCGLWSVVRGPWSVVCPLSLSCAINFYHEAFAAEPGIVYNQQEAIHQRNGGKLNRHLREQ